MLALKLTTAAAGKILLESGLPDLTLEGSAISDLEVFVIGQIDTNTFLSGLISQLDVSADSLQATGVSSVKTLFSPSENVADIIPLSLSSIVESGSSVVASFFATYDSTPNEIQISLKSSSA